MTPSLLRISAGSLVAGRSGCIRASRVFLEFTVKKTIEGSTQDLKEYTIGLGVYGRGKDYAPKIDSIVQSEAVRLRRRLEAYYASEGAADKLRIMYPKGSYVPPFVRQESMEVRSIGGPVCNTIAVLPFANLGAEADNQSFADGLTEELIRRVRAGPGLARRVSQFLLSISGQSNRRRRGRPSRQGRLGSGWQRPLFARVRACNGATH
jgi:hypothetical protein